MKNFIKLTIFAITLLILFSAFSSHFSVANSVANAQTISQQVTLTYPIPQLDSCRDAKECYLFCEIPANQLACQEFSLNHNLAQILGVKSDKTYSSSPFRQRVLQAATKRNISFPIPELDGCDSPEACRAFCAEEDNRQICRSFARNNNLTNQNPPGKITYPITELGDCDSKQACRAFCAEEDNRQICRSFAQSHGIKVRKKAHQLLQSAKQELDCDTLEQCKALCTNPENKTSCRDFGRKHREVNQLRSSQIRDAAKNLRSTDATRPAVLRNTNPNTLSTPTPTKTF